MLTINGDDWYKPKEIADLMLIQNSNGRGDYRFILRLIKSGKLHAIQWNDASKLPYYLVSQKEIDRYNKELTNGK